MATLTREQFVARKTKTISVEGGEIVIRQLCASEALELRDKDLNGSDILQLIADSIVEPKITAEEAGKAPAANMKKIIAEVLAFNAIGKKAIAEAQDELKKTAR